MNADKNRRHPCFLTGFFRMNENGKRIAAWCSRIIMSNISVFSARMFGAAVLCLALCAAACRTPAPVAHISPDMDFSTIKRVAVLPFNNLTNERFADEFVRQVVISEFLASGLADVVSPGEVVHTLETQNVRSPTALSAAQIRALANTLRVEAVVMGSVDRFGEVHSGAVSAPEVTVTLMMADASSGAIVWSVTKTRGSAGFLARHFGARSDTLSETVLHVVRDAVGTLTPP